MTDREVLKCSFCETPVSIVTRKIPIFGKVFHCNTCGFWIFQDENGKNNYVNASQREILLQILNKITCCSNIMDYLPQISSMSDNMTTIFYSCKDCHKIIAARKGDSDSEWIWELISDNQVNEIIEKVLKT